MAVMVQPRHAALGGRRESPPKVRRPRGPSPPPAASYAEHASSWSWPGKRLLQRFTCCHRRPVRAGDQQVPARDAQALVTAHQPTMDCRHQQHGINMIPGLRPRRSVSRPRTGVASERLERLVTDSQDFSIAFQEMILRDVDALGGFCRMRSVTPPPRDLIRRAVCSGEGSGAEEFAIFTNRTSGESGLPMFGNASEEDNTRPQPRSGQTQRPAPQVPLLRLAEVINSAAPRQTPAAEVRANSPCFGGSASSGSPKASISSPDKYTPRGEKDKSKDPAATKSLKSTFAKRSIRSSGAPRGRAPATTRGRAPHSAAVACTRQSGGGEESHSSSPANAKAIVRSLSEGGCSPFKNTAASTALPKAQVATVFEPQSRPELEAQLPAISPLKPPPPLNTSALPKAAADPSMALPTPKGKGKGKGKAPPPPPKGLAPPPKAKAMADRSRALSEEGWRGRRLYWRELAGAAEATHSIFNRYAECDEGNMTVTLAEGFVWEEYDHLFGAREEDEGSRRRAGSSSQQPRDTGETFLSQKQATSCSIILHRIGDLADVLKHLQHLDLDKMDEDDIGRLRELAELIEDVPAEKLKKVRELVSGKQQEKVRSIELQILPLFDIDRVTARIRLAYISCTLEAHRKHFTSTSAALAAATQEARNSGALKDFVTAAMSLRDYVQRGPEGLTSSGGPVRAMDIGSLLSGMREFKAVAPGTEKVSLLHFFARSLLRMRAQFDSELLQQLPGIAAGMIIGASRWQALHDDWTQLKADASFAKSELAQHDATRCYSDVGASRLTTLLIAVEAATADATTDLLLAATALEDLGHYFGVGRAREAAAPGQAPNIPRKDPSGLTVLCQLAELLSGFRRACDEVREQQRQEQQQQQQQQQQPTASTNGRQATRRPSLLELAAQQAAASADLPVRTWPVSAQVKVGSTKRERG